MKRLGVIVLYLASLASICWMFAPIRNAFALNNVDTTHLGVGILVDRDFDGILWPDCSGILVAPQVFITAGHCTSALQLWLKEGLSKATYVSFDTQFTPNASLIDVAELITHPDFNPSYNITSDTHDLGVVLLATPVYSQPVTRLPTADLLGSLRHHPYMAVTAAGYGVDSDDVHGAPSPGYNASFTGFRDLGTLIYRALTPAYIMVTQLANQGSDNICFGDSGGPDFMQVNGQEQLVALNVVVNSYSCEEVAWLYRLDTPQARSFLRQYVVLP
jgi:Trypsin